ncbi:MAG: preprotein translocase subunit YajC [Chloroflexi bacterium]|nr:preprotein translocase subunit YajC [Chloroflexota bacterium]
MEEFVILGLVLILGLGAYWSLVIFPRQRDYRKQQQYVRTLAVGDEMITYGGIIGRVVELRADEGIALVEIADGVVIRVVSASLLRPYDPEALAESVRAANAGQPAPDPTTTPQQTEEVERNS